MTNSRMKGKRGELEVCTLINAWTGYEVHRNLDQTRSGGSDIMGVPGWSVEVKRQKSWVSDWWTQTAAQAMRENNKPVLLYRLDRKPWRAQFCACALGTSIHFMVTTNIEDWLRFIAHEKETVQQVQQV